MSETPSIDLNTVAREVPFLEVLTEPLRGATTILGPYYPDEQAQLIKAGKMLSKRERHFVAPDANGHVYIYRRPSKQ